MADSTLLIPGTQATTLLDHRGVTVYNAVRVGVGLQKHDLGGRPPSEWQRLLSLENVPGLWEPSRTSLEPGTSITPGPVVGTPYDRMLSFADPWPYDWRADIRYNAILLRKYLEDNRPPDGGRWNLIGHSQGGLVIVLCSQLTKGVDDFARLVARVVLVGAPLAGTMKATDALLWGSEGLGSDREQIEAARGMARTWPALYQMLPSWDAVLRPNGDPVPPEQRLVHPDGWPGRWGEGIQDDLLLRALEAQALLLGPFSRFGPGVIAMAIQGKRQMTPVTVVRNRNQYPDDRTMRNQAGDSLVPSDRTIDWGDAFFRDRVVVLTGKPEPHAMLCQDEDVVDLTRRFLRHPAPPPPVADPT